jgi:hypothetical protein
MEETNKSIEVQLKYYLPEHQDDLNYAINGYKYSIVISELFSEIRDTLKFNSDFRGLKYSESLDDALEAVRDSLHEKLTEYSLKVN